MEVKQGVAILSGEVETQNVARSMQNLVAMIEGVQEIHNHLQLKEFPL